MKSTIFKAGWIPGLLLTILFILLYFLPSKPLENLEYKGYDFSAKQSTLAADSNIVIVGIDHASIRDFGPWPWPRSVLARAVDKLTAAEARLVVVDVLYESTIYSPELAQISRLQASSVEGREIIQQLKSLDEDQQLISAVQGNTRVLMPLSINMGKNPSSGFESLPASLQSLRIQGIASDQMALLSGRMLSYPYDALTAAAVGLGFDSSLVDRDGVLRSMPLVARYGDAVIPSLPLMVAAGVKSLSVADIRQEGAAIDLGVLSLNVDNQARLYPLFHTSETRGGYKYISFKTLLSKKFPLESLKGKVVMIGKSDSSMGEFFHSPLGLPMSNVEFQANMVQSILDQTYVSRPAWGKWVELALLIVCGLFLMLVLPRIHLLWSMGISLLLTVVIVMIGQILLIFQLMWLQTLSAALLLLFGLIVVSMWRVLTDIPMGGSAESDEQNKMLALSFQSQGMLDMAFEKLRLCTPNEDVTLCMYNLGIDFERKRQVNRAGDVYEVILGRDAEYKDVKDRMERLKSMGDGSSVGSGSMAAPGMDTLLVAGGTKPTLGRYEIVKELGKGAMGVVYLGRDPKINRYVAIKTMSLMEDFEADDVEEVKARFFREAKTAGMLNHPNIVTMFDVGEEHDLAYIAMEFLDGSDLAPYTKKGKLFPPQAVLKICGKVAEALHVAHSQSVIHRDIKPANIMLLKDKTVKVTDFGIARISAASKTKSGVVLGTPSYMSPEQLSGKHIDGRSDLFSLGVMMYEMLSGVRPFRGDSMATLMFQIANEPHPDIREHLESATESTARLMDRMLAKDPEARIANGAEVIRGIIQCLRDMSR